MPSRVMATPRGVDVEITSACNLRCAYCSHFSTPGDVPDDLPLDVWLRFFAVLGKASVMNVSLSGGEPFLRPDLKAVIDGIVANRMRFSILTNGTLLDDDRAAFLAGTGRCDSIQVSLDGSEPLSHDVFRGQGAFAQALAGIQLLQKHALPLTVRVTLHQKNVHKIGDIARFLLEEVGLPSFSTNAASHMGLCRRNAERIQLTPQEHTLAMETLLSLADAYPGRISATAGPLADGQAWLSMEQAHRDKKPPSGNGGFLTGCNGPMKTLAVRADGIYVPCLQLSHMALGHIDRDDLRGIWQGHPDLNRLRERSSIPLASFPFCRGCPYIPYCTGNCPATAFTLTGEVNHPSPDACLRRFLERGGHLPDRLALDPEG